MITLLSIFVGHGIKPRRVKRMTTREAFQREPTAPRHAKPVNRLDRVL